jgi:hypothetical protein
VSMIKEAPPARALVWLASDKRNLSKLLARLSFRKGLVQITVVGSNIILLHY